LHKELGKPKGKNQLEDLGVDRRIILVLNTDSKEIGWKGMGWICIGTSVLGNGAPGSVKCW
jgi:hypothetical protein